MSAIAFSIARLEALRRIESWHFWFVSRRELVASLLQRELREGETLLDVGCGTGASLSLAGAGVRRVGVDIHIEELTRGMLQGDATSLPLRTSSVDVILALDVLEHVDDDAMLAEVARVLRGGGRLIATVPAVRALWSVRDEAAGHRRRYSRAMVRDLLTRHGFRLRHLRGFQFVLLPMVLLSRLTRRKSVAARDFEDAPPRWLNRILLAVNRLELRLPRLLRPPVGSSLALVAVKEP
ncbi:MAG TPA: class I SAM-dependent methyltransferase [Thermoanaerobaculia bacterium]